MTFSGLLNEMTTILFLKAIYSTENKVIIFTKILIIETKILHFFEQLLFG